MSEWSDDESSATAAGSLPKLPSMPSALPPSIGSGGAFVLPTPGSGGSLFAAANSTASAAAAATSQQPSQPAQLPAWNPADEKAAQHIYLCLPVQLYYVGTMNQGILIPSGSTNPAPTVAAATILHDTAKRVWTAMFYDAAKRPLILEALGKPTPAMAAQAASSGVKLKSDKERIWTAPLDLTLADQTSSWATLIDSQKRAWRILFRSRPEAVRFLMFLAVGYAAAMTVPPVGGTSSSSSIVNGSCRFDVLKGSDKTVKLTSSGSKSEKGDKSTAAAAAAADKLDKVPLLASALVRVWTPVHPFVQSSFNAWDPAWDGTSLTAAGAGVSTLDDIPVAEETLSESLIPLAAFGSVLHRMKIGGIRVLIVPASATSPLSNQFCALLAGSTATGAVAPAVPPASSPPAFHVLVVQPISVQKKPKAGKKSKKEKAAAATASTPKAATAAAATAVDEKSTPTNTTAVAAAASAQTNGAVPPAVPEIAAASLAPAVVETAPPTVVPDLKSQVSQPSSIAAPGGPNPNGITTAAAPVLVPAPTPIASSAAVDIKSNGSGAIDPEWRTRTGDLRDASIAHLLAQVETLSANGTALEPVQIKITKWVVSQIFEKLMNGLGLTPPEDGATPNPDAPNPDAALAAKQTAVVRDVLKSAVSDYVTRNSGEDAERVPGTLATTQRTIAAVTAAIRQLQSPAGGNWLHADTWKRIDAVMTAPPVVAAAPAAASTIMGLTEAQISQALRERTEWGNEMLRLRKQYAELTASMQSKTAEVTRLSGALATSERDRSAAAASLSGLGAAQMKLAEQNMSYESTVAKLTKEKAGLNKRAELADVFEGAVNDMRKMLDKEVEERNRLEKENEQLQQITSKLKVTWVPDRAIAACMSCAAKFGILNSKHHCRYCGRVFCGKCTEKTMTLPPAMGYGNGKVRVCGSCFEHRTKLLSDNPKAEEL